MDKATSRQYKSGDIIDLRVEKIVPRGFGLSFAEGLTVLTPLTVPGDLLRVRLVEVKKRLAFGEILEILESGDQRVAPECPYFGVCGGCDFQQLSYPAQLAAKKEIILDSLRRVGKIDFQGSIEVIESPAPYGYRSRARWHLSAANKKLGYFRRDSHDIVDVTFCPILTPQLQSTLEKTRESLHWESMWSDEAQIEAAAGEDGSVSLFSRDLPETTTDLSFSAAGENYVFSAKTFFQANKFLIDKLIETAIGNASGSVAYDLYSGVGLFTLPLARRFGKVVAVEENSAAVELLRKNIENARLTNIIARSSSVAGFLRKADQYDTPDLVLLDPPRSGTERTTIESIARLKPAAISYVSCEPSILARDLRVLIDLGYSIESVTAVDLFPQTHHVETLVHLKRSAA